jgi:hypothetical protein
MIENFVKWMHMMCLICLNWVDSNRGNSLGFTYTYTFDYYAGLMKLPLNVCKIRSIIPAFLADAV